MWSTDCNLVLSGLYLIDKEIWSLPLFLRAHLFCSQSNENSAHCWLYVVYTFLLHLMSRLMCRTLCSCSCTVLTPVLKLLRNWHLFFSLYVIMTGNKILRELEKTLSQYSLQWKPLKCVTVDVRKNICKTKRFSYTNLWSNINWVFQSHQFCIVFLTKKHVQVLNIVLSM